jgi:general secretion pathway protein D
MINRTTLSAGIFLLLTTASWAQAPASAPGQSDAVTEAIYRQANQIRLRTTLEQARGAEARGDLLTAGQLYSASWDLVEKVGLPPSAPEAQQARAGLVATRSELAHQAQARGNYAAAEDHIKEVLRADPQNREALTFRQGNEKLMMENLPRTPSKEVQVQIEEIARAHATNTSHVTDARLLFEMGKIDESEAMLKQAIKEDPNNRTAYYYLEIIKEERFKRAAERRDVDSRQSLVEVEQDWATPVSKDSLPQPNPYARSQLIHTSKGRQAIVAKLDQIRMDSVKFDNVPLSAVISDLNDEAKKRDPYKRGLNFIINPNAESVAPAGTQAIDPATGLPAAAAAPAEIVDVGGIAIKLMPPLTDVRLADVLNAIVRVADKPLKYTIEDYAVVFSAKGPEAIPFYTRVFKVDPNTFYQGLQSVGAFVFGEVTQNQGGGGFGGATGGGGGGQQQGNQISGSIVSRVSAAPGGVTGGRNGGGGGGTGGAGGAGGGLKFLTTTNNMEEVQNAARNFFTTLGVTLTEPGKGLAWNDRAGELIVRGTLQDLETIEAAIQTLNRAPPQVNVKAKFVEVSQEDSKALGFDWFLGNVMMGNNKIAASGGTQPSFNGAPSFANPSGVFPGSLAGGTTLAPSATDQILTSGLRNSSPALFSLTGILTDPQFRVVIRALDQRSGADILASPEVTIISGRQAQMKAVEVKTVITSFQFGQQTGGGVTGGGGTVPSDRNIKTDFQAVDAQDILARVTALPISEWSYKADAGTRHIGPMAQDFKAAFKIGGDDKSIAIVDASGIALAAIKGLNEKNEKLESQIKQASAQLEAKDAEIKALKERLDKLEKLISRLDK